MLYEFTPTLDEQTVQHYIKLYEENPHQFQEKDIQLIQKHAEHYQRPFALAAPHQESTVGGAIQQLGAGFLSGFTTVNVGDEPKGTYEGIARSIGHLAGFAGMIPIPGKLARISKLAGALKSLQGKSVPMLAAKAVEKRVAPIAKNIIGTASAGSKTARGAATSFLQSHKVQDIIGGAFHLGVASAVSSWQGGVDEMMRSFIHGAETGGVFRVIGNVVKTGSEVADKTLRSLSSSLYTGLPSTMRDATTPEQVYEYLLGAYFGYKEMPYHRREGAKFIAKMRDPKVKVKDPALVEGWESLDKPTQEYVMKQSSSIFGKIDPDGTIQDADILAFRLAEATGIDIQEAQTRAKEYLEKRPEYNKYGEELTGAKTVEIDEVSKIKPSQIEGEQGTVTGDKSDISPGETVSDNILTKKTENWVSRNLFTEGEKKTRSVLTQRGLEVEHAWASMVKEAQVSGVNPAEQMMSWLANTYKAPLSLKAKRFWQQRGELYLKTHPVEIFNDTPGGLMSLKESHGINLLGQRKSLREDWKPIDDVYDNIVRGLVPEHAESPKQRAYVVFDGVIKEDPRTGRLREYTLIEQEAAMASGIKGPIGKRLRLAREEMSRYNANIANEMDKKGYYYFGGRGDATRQYFVRYHPEIIAQPRLIQQVLHGLPSHFKKAALEAYKTSKQDWIRRGNDAKMFDKAYVSNILYDMALNGFKTTLADGTFNKAGFRTVLTQNFINDAKAFNKRAQIWFTSGIHASPESIAEKVPSAAKGFKVLLVDEKDGHPLWTDGAIFGEARALQALNESWGLDSEGGVNKSFIVASHPKHGALLGKYMMHSVSPALNQQLEARGIHFIVPVSAAKQYGLRKPGSVRTMKNGRVVLPSKAHEYTIPIESVKGIMSETTDYTFTHDKRLPKQMFTNLTPYAYNTIKPEVIDDMFGVLSRRNFNGLTEMNERFDKYAKDPVKYEEELPEILERLDEIGIRKILETIQKPGNERLANEIYQRLLKTNDNVANDMLAEGDMTEKEYEAFKREAGEHLLVHQRIIDNSPDSLAGILHPFGRGYRMTTLQRYIVNRITRPYIGNSAAGRFRPYEWGLRTRTDKEGNTSLLKTRDDIFFLDEGFKSKKIYSELWDGYKTLGRVWEELNAGVYGQKGSAKYTAVEDVLTAATIRVPMDSLQGARVLKFKGFTGLKGYGILAHPKVLEAEGGADLDGDKGFIFFGDESHGFKKSWKKMYSDQANEFGDMSTGEVKKKYAAGFVEPETTSPEVNRILQYSPLARQHYSEAAMHGRSELGPTVVARATINAAYTALMNSPQQEYTYSITKNYKGKSAEFLIIQKPKDSAEARNKFAEMARAFISYTSDPMDFNRIHSHKFYSALNNTLFDYHVLEAFESPSGKRTYQATTKAMNLSQSIATGNETHIQRKGLTRLFSGVNTAMYGRNIQEGRRWLETEIASKLSDYEKNTPEAKANSFLGKLAEEMKGIEWSDSIFARINKEAVSDMITEHNRVASRFGYLAELMERDSLRLPMKGRYVDWVLNRTRLWDKARMYELAESSNLNVDAILDGIYLNKETSRNLQQWSEDLHRAEKETFRVRKELRLKVFNQMLELGEDYLMNDLADIASLSRVTELLSEQNHDLAVVQHVAEQVNKVKKAHAKLRKKRRSPEYDMLEQAGLSKEEIETLEALVEEGGKSVAVDQANLDRMIAKQKAPLTSEQRDLYDAFLLGTFNVGHNNLEGKIRQAEQKIIANARITPESKSKIISILENKLLKAKDNSTNINRVGFASSEVSEWSIKKYLDHYGRLFNKASAVKPETIKRVQEEAATAEVPKPVIDPDGNLTKGTVIESSDLNEGTQKYLKDYKPFEGLHDGTLSKEAKAIYTELKDHLEYYHNSVGKKLHHIVRATLNKDLNNLNLEDFRVLNRMFEDMRNGTAYQRLRRSIKKGGKLDLTGWYYHMFPEAVAKDMMRLEFELMPTKQMYFTRDGGIVSGEGKKPLSTMGMLVDVSHYVQDTATRASEEEKKKLKDQLSPFIDGLEDGRMLHEMAIRTRELGVRKSLAEYYGTQGIFKHYVNSYSEPYRKAVKKHNWKEKQFQQYVVKTREGTKTMTGKEIVEKMNDIYTAQNEQVYKWLRGNPEKIETYLGDKTPEGMYHLRKRFFADFTKAMQTGGRLDLGLGVDGLRRVVKRILLSQVGWKNKELLKAMDENIKLEGTETGKYDARHYFPHLDFDRKLAGKALKEAMEIVLQDKGLSTKERTRQLKGLSYHYKQLTGDYIPTDEFGEVYKEVDKVIEEITISSKQSAKKIKWGNVNHRVGNQLSRKAHIPGWSVEPEAYESYMKRVLDGYYRLVGQVVSKVAINDFFYNHHKTFKDAEFSKRWSNFLKLYVQQALGFPAHIPDHILHDPKMKISGTPYAWFADSVVKARLNRIKSKLGIKKDVKLPEELKEVSYQQLSKWSNLEAKYELAALLAHPKSAVANLYGGTVHTVISTGYDNFKKARNFDYLAQHINPKWRNMEDVAEWVRSHGVIEEFMVYQAGLEPAVRNKKWKTFFNEAMAKMKSDPDMSDTSLLSLAKSHGITKQIFDKAAWFMRKPERTLRRDAFVAHYLQAAEQFGGAIQDYNHPFLIEMAKKGVKGTQFLYGAPHRPMFASSALGKVMSRFQLWSWNSVRFRNDVIRQAHIYGWKEGTPEFDRFKRLAVADLMMLSLASVFAYSIFENALPAPWNWFQDTADWMFGDDKERERAFFGAYPAPFQPLQVVTPSFARMLPATFKGMVTGDYSKLADYYAWTMFPFGRLGRDIFGPGGLTTNPSRGVEKLTGFPYMQFSREYKEEKEKDKIHPRGIL